MIYIFCALIIVICHLIRKNYKQTQFVGAYSGFLAGILVYYALIPLLIIVFKEGYYLNPEIFGFNDVVRLIIEVEPSKYYKAVIFVLIALGFFCLSYKYRTPIVRRRNRDMRSQLVYIHDNVDFVSAAKCLFWICVPSVIIYVIALGGLSRALLIAEELRSFSASLSTYTHPIFGYFNIFAGFISICSLLWLNVFINRKSMFSGLAFVITVITTIIYCLVEAGRTKLLIYIFLLFYISFRKKIKHIWIIVFLLIPIAAPLIDILSELFIYFQTGNISVLQIKSITNLNFIRQFAYAFRSVLYLQDIMNNANYLFFKNIVLDTISILPLVKFDESYILVSEFFNGFNWRQFGGIPTDFITYGYINMSVFGIMISSWTLGKICYHTDKYLKERFTEDNKNFWGIVISSGMFSLIASADWSAVLFNNCNIIVPLILFYINSRKH